MYYTTFLFIWQVKRRTFFLLCKKGFLSWGNLFSLFAFEAVATGALFRFTVASVADVNLGKRTVIARAVEFTIRNAAANAHIHFSILHTSTSFFIFITVVCANCLFLIDFLKKILYNNKKENKRAEFLSANGGRI